MIRFNSGVTSDFAASVFSSFASPAAAVVSLAAAAAVVAAGLEGLATLGNDAGIYGAARLVL